MSVAVHYLEDIRSQFGKIKKHVEDAIAQVSDGDLMKAIDPESNSLALIVKHMAGNLRSRFTDFLTTDGEKPDRNRDGEFEDAPPRAALMTEWERGWSVLFASLESLTPADLLKQVKIRDQSHTVIEALHRALVHQSHHAGQVVFLAKHLRSGEWKTLSLPRRPRADAGLKPRATT
jgi:uncharacterized damage-inducible protein DinB